MIELLPIQTKKVNFLNNSDMLKEIHKSKNSFSEYLEPKYKDYDIIIEDKEDIYKIYERKTIILDEREFSISILEQAQINRAAKLTAAAFEIALSKSTSKLDRPKIADYTVNPKTVPLEDLVFRVITFEHIPLAPGRKKNPKREADSYVKLNFLPFKHYVIENNEPKEVGASHTKDGKFNLIHGSITDKLARMFILMVEKYGQRRQLA